MKNDLNQNPFTTTFSKLPQYSYIETDSIKDIIANFSFENPSESVYKITGVRGSGKTVLLSKIEEILRENKKWVVYNLSSSRDLLLQLYALLYKDGFIINSKITKDFNLSTKVFNIESSFSIKKEKLDIQNDIGIEVERGIINIKKKGRKLFLGIDEIYKSKEMTIFTSEFGKWLISQYPVYLVCTGLYENVCQLANVKNLTFLRRATTLQTEPLDKFKMTEMYKNKLKINHGDALNMSLITKGYPYAFQIMGILAFKRRENETINDLISKLKGELYSYSYEKIWEELSKEDKLFAISLCKFKKRNDIIKCLGQKSNNYSVYRDRLIKRGLIKSINNENVFTLPFFEDFIENYHSD